MTGPHPTRLNNNNNTNTKSKMDLEKLREVLRVVRRVLAALLVATVLQQTVYRKLRDRMLGLPPGPLPMPLIGTFYELSEPNKPPGLHKDLFRLMKKWGPIYTLYFGAHRGVVLNSPELWYEALNLKQDQTSRASC